MSNRMETTETVGLRQRLRLLAAAAAAVATLAWGGASLVPQAVANVPAADGAAEADGTASKADTLAGISHDPLADPQLSDAELGIVQASSDPTLAINGFQKPDGVDVSVVAAEPLIANGVAFTFDNAMNLYVCETYRQNHGVEDNRSHMEWLVDDLANQTVADRAAMLERYIEDDAAAYKIRPDRLRYLTGRDESGAYQESSVFASFRDLVDGTAAGVLTVENESGTPDVYFTCIPDLYKLRDVDADGRADELDSLLTGFGVRVTFRGHDMHGLIRGIDGKLYWSIGDRGYHVTTPDGTVHHRPNTGAVFRANLDGSDFEVFAYGLRNPQELAFNDTGDLFSVDNNSDSGDLARLVHIMEGSDAGWRLYYQYREDRGPWNREAMWQPQGKLADAAEWVAGFDESADERAGGLDPTRVQPAYILPPIENITDGPSGFVCYPGTGWGDLIADNRFFIADFRGTNSKSGVRSFSVSPSGAHFTMDDDDDQFIWQLLATDVDFGYDGAMYVLDWVDGWSGVGKGRLYKFDPPAEPTDDIAALFAGGFKSLDTGKLVELISHADRRVRMNAQWELADRGAADELIAIARSEAVPARYHGIWGTGQIYAAKGTDGLGNSADGLLDELLGSGDSEVVRQTLRALSWSGNADLASVSLGGGETIAWENFVDAEPRVQAAAAITFGRLAAKQELTVPLANRFIDMLAANDDADPALRHALTYGLSQIGRDREDDGSRERVLLTAIADGSDAVQRAGAVVLRRWGSPEVGKLLKGTPPVALEAARAIYDEPIVEAMPLLAAVPLDEDTPEPLARRVVAANFAVAAKKAANSGDGSADAAKRLVEIAADARISDTVRSEALAMLAQWDDPQPLDRTIGQFRKSEPRSLDTARPALSESIDTLLGDADVREAALPLVGQYGLAEAAPLVVTIVSNADIDKKERVAGLESLEVVAPQATADLVPSLLKDDAGAVRSAARAALSRIDPEAAVPVLDESLKTEGLREQQSAIRTLAAMERGDADAVLQDWLGRMAADAVPAGIKLELLEAAESRELALAKAEDASLPASIDAVGQTTEDYLMCLEGGDAGDGADVFYGYAAAACRRCHVVNGSGAAVGPNLSEIGKQKDRRYLLEAIIEPNKAIAKGFGTKLLLLADGRVLSGIVAEEDDETLTLVKPTGERELVVKDDIDAEKDGQSGMPADLYKQLTRRDIRNLVEYLASLKEEQVPKDEDGHAAE